MMVMPFTCAFTSRRRFTLLKVFSAAAIASFGTPQEAASAAAAVAFQTLYSPASGNSRSAQGWPSCRTVQRGARGFEAQVGDLPVRARAGAVALDGAERLGQTALQAWAFCRLAGEAIEGYDASAARNQIHQAFECGLDGVEIFVDVGVIELDRSQNDRVGKIVQELRSFVEESGVVFVAFEDEVLAGAEMKARTEILGDAADQE